ncbi:hypothetical protein ACFWPQ_36490 [Streptomyces sp. NPDC058464]|uniref:hypothetical protein n=1 Tax=Streptomyces sp. NPDC058464 TaxID=3346511 RepID=UPI00364793E0
MGVAGPLGDPLHAVPEEPARTGLYAGKAATMAAAQRAGIIDDTIEPGTLVFLVIALSSYWAAAPQIARMLTPAGPGQSSARAAAVHAAERMVAPRPDRQRNVSAVGRCALPRRFSGRRGRKCRRSRPVRLRRGPSPMPPVRLSTGRLCSEPR